ncbi:MAG: rcp1 3 [Bryobacterales bacterium]|jgi:CheY-like chemotaxis protein|nr:rcp1 3 [Bryobacterales bacterium]
MVHILLIEDNVADVMLVREALRTCSIPADVMIAYDGEQGLRLLTELNFQPDFILLDLNLPKFSGLQLLERYHAQEGPPLIVLSGSNNPSDKERALELGARDYVQKPMTWPDFIQAVHDIVRRWAGRPRPAA